MQDEPSRATVGVRVLLFAALAEAAGVRELIFRGNAGLTPASLWREMEDRFPRLRGYGQRIQVAVNKEYAEWDQPLREGDEVAYLLPVSGGNVPVKTRGDGAPTKADGGPAIDGPSSSDCWITYRPLQVDEVLRRVSGRPDAGAVVLFAGTVRRVTGERITEHLEYEAYPEMAVSEMQRIADEVKERWPGSAIAMVHRVGRVQTGEASVLIAVSTPHRAEAFAAGRYAIDRLKERVPVWKKEVWAGGEMWVGDAREGGGRADR